MIERVKPIAIVIRGGGKQKWAPKGLFFVSGEDETKTKK
jgi:hypothetical protein